MKKIVAVLTILTIALFAVQAQATVLLDDDFESYSTGLLTGQTAPAPSGQTWVAKWGSYNAGVSSGGGNTGQAVTFNIDGVKQNWSQLPLGTTVTAASAENIINFSVDLTLGSSFGTYSQAEFHLMGPSGDNLVDCLLQAKTWELIDGSWVELPMHTSLIANVFGVPFLYEYDIEDFAWTNIWGQIDLGAGEATVGFDNGTQSAQNTFSVTVADIDALWLGVEADAIDVDTGTRVDNIFVEAVPEPATLAVLAIGGLLALSRRRK